MSFYLYIISNLRFKQIFIPIIQSPVDEYHHRIENIKSDHEIGIVNDFIDDSKNVSEENNIKEYHALSFDAFTLDALIDIDWPSEAKANQHAYFKNAHIFISCGSII